MFCSAARTAAKCGALLDGGVAAGGALLAGAVGFGAAGARDRSGARTRAALPIGQRHLAQQPRVMAATVTLAHRITHLASR